MKKIYFDNVLIDTDYYGELTKTSELYNGKFRLGATLCETYNFTVDKTQIENKEPSVVHLYNDDELEKTLFVDDYKEDDFTITYELTDSMVNFNFGYDASQIFEDDKTTLGDIFQDICLKANITTDITTFDYSSMEVSWYDNSITARDYLGFIATLNGSFLYITSDNKLAMSKVKQNSKITINFDEIGNYKIGQRHKITKVVWDDGVNHWEYGDETGDTYYLDTANVYIVDGSIVEHIYDEITNFEFYDFEVDNMPIKETKNIFDYKTATYRNGYYLNNDGEEVENSNLGYINSFIKVEPNTEYTFSGELGASGGYCRVYYYDEEKQWILRSGAINVPLFTITTPVDCHYVQLQYRVTIFSASTVQIEKGAERTEYEDYISPLHIGDIITFTDGTNDYITIYQPKSLKLSGNNWYGGLSFQIETAKQDETQIIDTGKRIKSIKNIVDRDNNRITNLITETSTIKSDLRENYYTLEQTNELVQNSATGITNTFTEAGGNNIFRNTGLWFETQDENNPYEFWNGKVIRQKEENSSNMNAMLLQNNVLYQEQTVPNGDYTITFKYKKLIALSTITVSINDIVTELTETDTTDFSATITVTNKNINIKFTADINNSCEIYDLMVNAGSVGLAYTQNQNETTTDTVNISKGITITSTDTETTFKANADGIRTLDKNGNKITDFTDTGMTTKEAIITSKSQIVGTIWQEVGSQTWITRM